MPTCKSLGDYLHRNFQAEERPGIEDPSYMQDGLFPPDRHLVLTVVHADSKPTPASQSIGRRRRVYHQTKQAAACLQRVATT